MKKQTEDLANAALLRQEAEELLKLRTDARQLSTDARQLGTDARPCDSTKEADLLKLIHELEVHQIELEMQNEELVIAKEKAELAEEKYTELYDFAPSGYLSLSKDGKITELNFAAARMLGKERLRLVTRNFALLVSEGTRPVFNAFFQLVCTGNEKQSCEVTLATEGNPAVAGQVLPNYVSISGILSQNGGLCQLNLVDITERKQAEMALKDSENHARSMIEAIPDLMFVLDSEGVYLDFKADVADLAYQKESIIGKKNRDIIPPDFADLIDEKIKRTLQTGSMQIFEYQLELPQKGICYFEARMVQCGNDRVLAIVRNITERKSSDAKILEINKQLTDLNATKDKFFSIIAHDLKSPFNAIMGFSELLTDQIEVKDYEGIDEYAKIIGQSSQRAMDLLASLLDWSRLQTGRMEFNPENFELVDLIIENKVLLDDIATQKAITIKKTLPHNLAVFADKPMISTVLRNLISNAIKFTRQGGEIVISAEKRENEILVSVNDNGVGISPKRFKGLFRIDESDSTTGTNNERGTGLGLILCKEFVEKHHGSIWAESEEGKGSTFYFTLS